MCLLDKSVVQEHYRLYYRQAWLISKDTRPSRLPAHFIHSLTHSSSSRASLIYIYIYYYYTKKITKTNKTVMCMQGEGRNIHCIALFKLFGCSHPPVPTHPPNRGPNPTDFFFETDRNFRKTDFCHWRCTLQYAVLCISLSWLEEKSWHSNQNKARSCGLTFLTFCPPPVQRLKSWSRPWPKAKFWPHI